MANQEVLVGGNKENISENTYELDPDSYSMNGVLPMTEVYLTEDTSCFQLEEEDLKDNEIPITCINIDSDSNDSDIEFVGEHLKNDEDPKVIHETQPTLINDRNTFKEIKTKNEASDNNSKISIKYNRQTTPLCDAIMKEYTKWQKNPSSSSEFPIKDLIKNSKSIAKSQLQNKPYTNSLVSVVNHEVTKCKPKAFLSREIQEDVKPKIATINAMSLKDSASQTTSTSLCNTRCDVESKKDSKPNSSSRKRNLERNEEDDDPTYLPNIIKKLVSSDDSHNISQNVIVVKKKRGRPFKNPTSVNKLENKPQPTASTKQCTTPTGLEEQGIKRKRGRPRKIEIPLSVQKSELTADITDANFQNSPITQPEVKNVAKHLKLIAEKISSELDNSSCPNIEEETKTLLKATQTLIRLQNDKGLLKNVTDPVSSLETIGYNEETNPQKPFNRSTFENSSNRSLNHHTLKEVINRTIDQNLNEDEKEFTQSKQNSVLLQALLQNQNFGQHENSKQNSVLLEALLQKQKLEQHKYIEASFTAPVKETSSPLANEKSESNKLPNLKTRFQSQPSSNQLKSGFIKDFITSYQKVFNGKVLSCVIPKLSEILLLCLDHFVEVVQRTIKANSVTSENLRNQEILLAKRSFAKVIYLYSNRFFSDFNSVIEQISKTKTDKALVVTFILFVSISISQKNPKYQRHIHSIKKVLICMYKAHKETNQLLWSVLNTTDDVYSEIVHVMAKILTYFQKQNLIQIPFSRAILTDLLLFCRKSKAAITPHTNKQDLNTTDQQTGFSNLYKPDERLCSNRTNPKPNNAVQFGETLPDSTKDYNFLESYKNINSFSPPEDKSSSLTEVLPNNLETGLDNLFFKSYFNPARKSIDSEFINCNFTNHSHSINESGSPSESARSIPNISKSFVNSTTSLNFHLNLEQDDPLNFIEFASVQLSPENTVSADLDSSSMLAGEDEEPIDPLFFSSIMSHGHS